MLSFNQSLFLLVKDGKISLKEALSKASNPQACEMNFKASSSTKVAEFWEVKTRVAPPRRPYPAGARTYSCCTHTYLQCSAFDVRRAGKIIWFSREIDHLPGVGLTRRLTFASVCRTTTIAGKIQGGEIVAQFSSRLDMVSTGGSVFTPHLTL